MKSFRSLIAASVAASAMFAVPAGAQYAPMPGASAPEGPSKTTLLAEIDKAADVIQAGTDKYCRAEFDGDKSKGEHTNADVARLVRGMARIADGPSGIPLDAVHAIVTGVAENDFTICFDKRVKDLNASNVPEQAHELLKTHSIKAVLYPAATTVGFTPVPIDAKDPDATSTAILVSFHRLANRANQFNEANMAAQMLGAMGHPQAQQAAAQAHYFASTPFLFLYNPGDVQKASNGPAKDAGFLMENPVIRDPSAGAPANNTPQLRPTGLHI